MMPWIFVMVWLGVARPIESDGYASFAACEAARGELMTKAAPMISSTECRLK